MPCEKVLALAAAQRIGKRNLLVDRHRHHFLVALVGRKIDETLNLQVGVETIFAAARFGIVYGRGFRFCRRAVELCVGQRPLEAALPFEAFIESMLIELLSAEIVGRMAGGVSAGSCSGGEFFGCLRGVATLAWTLGTGATACCCALFFLLLLLLLLLQARHLHLVDRALRGIGRHGTFAVHDLLDHLVVGKFFGDFLRTHVQRAKSSEARFDCAVRNFVGMQLQIDPAVDAHRHDLLHVAGPRTEGEAIERVHGALLFVRALFVRARIGGLVLLLGEQLRDCAGEAQAQQEQRWLPQFGSHEDSPAERSPDYEPFRGKKLLLEMVREAAPK